MSVYRWSRRREFSVPFENVKNSNHQGPVLIHVRTQKGKGYKPAEDLGDKYHGVSKFNISTGEQTKSTNTNLY